jgi:phosphatidylinositol kinase/protein kinase (PI-3  family)
MVSRGNEHLPCFQGKVGATIDDLRKRFRSDLGDRAAADYMHGLIEDSMGNWTTTCYDRYQRCCVGIF